MRISYRAPRKGRYRGRSSASAKPDLNELGRQLQEELRLRDWRVSYEYVPDLADAKGNPVYGLCKSLIDNKTALIQVRDPSTPVPGEEDDPSGHVLETVIHELGHLLLAPLCLETAAEVAQEENIVWAFSEALAKGKTIREAARAVGARYACGPEKKRETVMLEQLIAAGKAAAESGDPEAIAKALADLLAAMEEMAMKAKDGTDPMDGEQGKGAARRSRAAQNDAEQAAVRLRAIEDSSFANLKKMTLHTMRVVDGLEMTPKAESLILSAPSVDAMNSMAEMARAAHASSTKQTSRSRAHPKGADLETLTPYQKRAYEERLKKSPESAEEFLKACGKENAKRAGKAG